MRARLTDFGQPEISAVPIIANSLKFNKSRIAVNGTVDSAATGIATASTDARPVISGAP